MPYSYPMKTIGELRSSSFLRCGRAVFTCATQPKVHKNSTSGLQPCQASHRVLPATLFVGARFRRKTAVETASPQNAAGTPLPFSKLLAMVTTDWFLLSTTLFCYDVYGAECCRFMPCLEQCSSNATEVNSPS